MRHPRTYVGRDLEPSGQTVLPLFDRKADAFERGMDASAAAGAKWTTAERDEVDRAIVLLAERRAPFTTDDVWRIARNARVTKGVGARLRAAVRSGLIVNTGERRVSKRGNEHDHAQSLTVWKGA